MRTDKNGNIEIIRNSGKEYENGIINRLKNPGNNIISSNYSFDQSKIFRNYIIRSNSSTDSNSKLGDEKENKKATNQFGKFEDETSREGRQKVLISQESAGSVDNKDQAKWIADFSRSTRFSYSVTLRGHSVGNEIFQPNKLIKVYDDFTGVDDLMLIGEIELSSDTNNGDTSTITLFDKNSFNLTMSDPSKSNTKNKEAKNTGFSLKQ